MNTFLEYLLESIGGITVLVAAISVLSKRLIDHRFNKDLKKFTSELEHANQISIIELKAKTEIMFHEYKENIKNLSPERIKAVKDVHNKLITAWASYYQMLSLLRQNNDIPIYQQIMNDVNSCIRSYNDLLECAKFNEVFLPTSISNKIFEWRKKIGVTCQVYGPIISNARHDYEWDNTEHVRLWEERGIEEATFEEIRSELKRIIGVEN